MTKVCSSSRIDSKVAYRNAYVEARMKIGLSSAGPRAWYKNTAQLGYWMPNYPMYQHFVHDGPYNLEEFNVFAFQWNYDTVDFFVNGVKTYSSTLFDQSVGYTQAQQVIFSLWDGSPYPDFSAAMDWNSPMASKFTMTVDYVKICT
jgi:hypothetical protein